MMICYIPERRTDLTTRAQIDALLTALRTAETGLLLYSQLMPTDTRTLALLERCEAERAYYMQRACTLQATTNESEDML